MPNRIPLRSQGVVLRPKADGSVENKFWNFVPRTGYQEATDPNHPENHLVVVTASGKPEPAYSFYIYIGAGQSIDTWSIKITKGDFGNLASPFSESVTDQLRQGNIKKDASSTLSILGIGPGLVLIGGHYDTQTELRSKIVNRIHNHYKIAVSWTHPDGTPYTWDPEMEVDVTGGTPPQGSS